MLVPIVALLLVQTIMCEVPDRIITSLKDSPYRVEPKIVHGEPVHNERVPYMVSFKEPCNRLGKNMVLWCNLCGGSIISAKRVLTAAHCFEGQNYLFARNPDYLRVFAGSNVTSFVHSGNSMDSPDFQCRRITHVVLHRKFYFPHNDIALAFMDNPWTYTDKVFFIKPATRSTDYGQTCVSAGFGKTDHMMGSEEAKMLMMASINVITRWRCSVLWDMNMNDFVCTDEVFGDVAKGDSGGPLACFDVLEDSPSKEVLAGVVSGKNFDKTTLFTRVSAYKQWIATDAAVSLAAPPLLLLITAFIVIYLLFYFVSSFGKDSAAILK